TDIQVPGTPPAPHGHRRRSGRKAARLSFKLARPPQSGQGPPGPCADTTGNSSHYSSSSKHRAPAVLSIFNWPLIVLCSRCPRLENLFLSKGGAEHRRPDIVCAGWSPPLKGLEHRRSTCFMG